MIRCLAHPAHLTILVTLMSLPVDFGRAADDFKIEDGYICLFMGKNLTGWRSAGAKSVVIMNEKDNMGKGGIRDLYTSKPFDKNFHLNLKFRAAAKADSGAYIRGLQSQVRDFIRRGEQKHMKKFKNDD